MVAAKTRPGPQITGVPPCAMGDMTLGRVISVTRGDQDEFAAIGGLMPGRRRRPLARVRPQPPGPWLP
jgi:hypothetical protein